MNNRTLSVLSLLTLMALALLVVSRTAAPAQAGPDLPPAGPGIQGPLVSDEVKPYDFSGDLSTLPQAQETGPGRVSPRPFKYTPGTHPKGSAPQLDNWIDPVLQDSFIGSLMPSPASSFEGISFATGGSGWPPDTNGDVGPNHYIQTVNTSIGVYSKATGLPLSIVTFDTFFTGTGTPCDYSNSGDPIVVYDRFAQRWVITDFSVDDPYYECIAVSKTSDPVAGGWWMYAVHISDTLLNDYPKVGVWHNAYYISYNMFLEPDYDWAGVQVWAYDKARMINGQPVRKVGYSLSAASGYASLLPAHALDAPSPAAPGYFATLTMPNKLQVWKFTPNFASPELSSFTGPQEITVAAFAAADSVPQLGSSMLLDSLSPRPMMQMIYRIINGVESLWLTHTVTNQGVGAMRWYEVRQPAAPMLFQQGTYQPDMNHRWMGALAVDRDGNMGLGYSISNTNMFPGIRYTGRLAGESLGQLPQGEATLISGSGAQLFYNRWGDYSSMSVDPVDDCTFWYTTEYYSVTGTNWQTRIGAFKFPSCGQAKGHIKGVVRNSVTLQPIPAVAVKAQSGSQMMTVNTDNQGVYTITLTTGVFSVTAGPKAPGYPNPQTENSVNLTAGQTTTRDILLAPIPYLQVQAQAVADAFPKGNGNTFPEPGESGLGLQNTLRNSGAITATNITAELISLTGGVTVTQNTSAYPDMAGGSSANNQTQFLFDIDPNIACGSDMSFRKVITDHTRTYSETFSIAVGIPLSKAELFSNNFEAGAAGWSTGGVNNSWALSTTVAHSPSHAWSDSPNGDYLDGTDSFLLSPVFDLSEISGVELRFWTKFNLEPGYDYVYLEYSTNGGGAWTGGGSSLAVLNGVQDGWSQMIVPAGMLDKQANVRLRFRLVSDGGVTADGIYIDDFALAYQPYSCFYGLNTLWLPVMRK